MSIVGDAKIAKRIAELRVCKGWHKCCNANESESEPSRVPVVISGLWR